MPSNSERGVAARRQELLRILPSTAPGKTAGEIHQELTEDSLFGVSKRAIQRDLHALRNTLACDMRDATAGYSYWLKKPAQVGTDDMEVVDALTWRLIESSLRPLLPKVVLDVLEPRLKTAANKLDAIRAKQAVTDWPNKVASELPMVPFVPPEIAHDVLREVQYALIHDYVFSCEYKSIKSGRYRTHKLHPLGLLQRGQITYLVATIDGSDQPLRFALHRMREVKSTIDELRRPPGFSLQQFLKGGGGQFGSAGRIGLVIEVSPTLATVLSEAKLDAQQIMSEVGEGKHRIEAMVQHTWQLEWWLLSKLGDLVVLEPDNLRQTIVGLIKRGIADYGIAPEAK